jgi:hypothetical protein
MNGGWQRQQNGDQADDARTGASKQVNHDCS